MTEEETRFFIAQMRGKVARSQTTWPDDWRHRFTFYDGEVAGMLDALALMEPPVENGFLVLVEHELKRARTKHTKPLHSHHEAYAVVLEELAEVWDEVRQQTANPQRIIAELIQVAAMCARWAEDVCVPEGTES